AEPYSSARPPRSMGGHMRLAAVLLLCLLAIAAPATAATAPKPHRIVLGIAEQNSYVFDSPLFAPLGLRQARTVVAWDAVLKHQTEKLDAWLAGAKANHAEPLVSFAASE